MGQNIEWFPPAEVFAEARGRSRAIKQSFCVSPLFLLFVDYERLVKVIFLKNSRSRDGFRTGVSGRPRPPGISKHFSPRFFFAFF